MSRLLTDELRKALPELRGQEGVKDPLVFAAFFLAASGWIWFVTEGEAIDNEDFLFFGYVIGLEREWGHFSLRELEEVQVDGLRIERDMLFAPRPFSETLL